MPSTNDELRLAKIRQLEADTRHAILEGDYAVLKIQELTREQGIAGNHPGEDNIFTFYGEVNDKNVHQAMIALSTFSRRTPGCDITIYLTTEGGSGMAGFALYDYIRQLEAKGHKVTIVAIGYCMSMGVTLLQAATDRVATPNTTLLVHEASFDPGHASTSEHEDRVRRTKNLQDRVFAALSEKSNLSVAQIRRKARKNEWEMNAEEALRVGLIDRIA